MFLNPASSLQLQLLNRGPEGPLCWMLAFSTASCLQLQLLNRGSWGLPLLGAGLLYRILFPTETAQSGAWGSTLLGAGFLYLPHFVSNCLTSSLYPGYIIVRRTNRTHSTRPRSRLYSDIPRPDAPVIYTGAFPILTAQPGRRSIYNTTLKCFE